MDLLGPTMNDLHKFCGYKFSLKTTLKLGIQLVQRLEHLHDKGYINRDIKPENLTMGLGQACNTVHLIDMGISKRFMSKRSGQHIPYAEGRPLVGTPCYSSINADKGCESSRRDDLEGLIYTLILLHSGFLPWAYLVRDEDILNMKTKLSSEKICEDCPQEFATFLAYCR